MRHRVVACAALLLAATCTPANLTPFLQAKADAFVKPETLGGVILAIGERDGHVSAASAGHQSDAGPIPADGRVRIGSVTKTFVAVVVLQLADEGKISLDASARTYVSDPGLPADVTVRNLLQHTSGIPNYVEQPGFADLVRPTPERAVTPQEVLGLLRDVPPLFEPGSKWSYSNTNYVYLGLLIEAVTGKPVERALRTRIIEPLGLRDTYFAGRERGPPVIHAPIVVGGDPYPYNYPYTSSATSTWTAGAMVSSAADLGAFFAALFDGRLISNHALQQMKAIAPGSETKDPPAGYGLGLTVWTPAEYPGLTLYGHGGGVPGFSTLVFHDPDKGITYFAVCNDPRRDLKQTMLDMVGRMTG